MSDGASVDGGEEGCLHLFARSQWFSCESKPFFVRNNVNDCASDVMTVVTSILVYFPLLVLFAFGGVERLRIKEERERIFFRNEYSLSVERMVAESPVDRNKVLELKRKLFGRSRAIHYVRKWDPVPPRIAALFVDAIR